MVKVMTGKNQNNQFQNLKPLLFNLEKEEWEGEKFDLLITQMVLHHVADLDNIFKKFKGMIVPGGCLAIADLYTEDGSFHGEGFTGHKGFDTDILADLLRLTGFWKCFCKKVFRNKKGNI
ncbi:MAG: methyltransferase domain-containing protein [Sphingobacterium sp.]|nr:methyltransferase domain-containing protein [Sphingobacterium sp.]